jgi:hypothetical protein
MSLYTENKYRFIFEDGEEELTHEEYLSTELRKRFGNLREPMLGRQRLFLGRTLVSYPDEYLAQSRSKRDIYAELLDAKNQNPLQFFAPSGPVSAAVINDRVSRICLHTSGNRNGKTANLIVKLLLRLIPTDPDWTIFAEHGIEWHPFRPDIHIGLASYEWNNHKKTLWPEILRWIPIAECGPYHPRFQGESKTPSWKDNPILPVECGNEVHMYAYNQDQAAYESEALDDAFWDEQPPEDRWDGMNERLRTNPSAQHNHGLTPHSIPGRPDTGAGSFVHKIHSGKDTKGYLPSQIRKFALSLTDVPDWIKTEESKKEQIKQWITDPMAQGNMTRYREGRARVYGEFIETSGLVYPEWDIRFHWIEPFEVPRGATLFRYIDHGRTKPCAALFGFVHPSICEKESVLVLYMEYYASGRVISENARGIIEMSGNSVVEHGRYNDKGRSYPAMKELCLGSSFLRTKMDKRSLNRPLEEQSMTIGQMYRVHGLRVQPATAARIENTIDAPKQWLSVDHKRNHPIRPMKGFTKVLVFNTLVNFREEIEGYIERPARGKNASPTAFDSPRPKDDHLLDCFRYMIADDPRYIFHEHKTNRRSLDITGKPKDKQLRDRFTGYRY